MLAPAHRLHIEPRAKRKRIQKPLRRKSDFDSWRRGALAVLALHVGTTWTVPALMKRFGISRAAAKRDLAKLAELPGVTVSSIERGDRRNRQKAVSLLRTKVVTLELGNTITLGGEFA